MSEPRSTRLRAIVLGSIVGGFGGAALFFLTHDTPRPLQDVWCEEFGAKFYPTEFNDTCIKPDGTLWQLPFYDKDDSHKRLPIRCGSKSDRMCRRSTGTVWDIFQ